jgi:hypothetical protein
VTHSTQSERFVLVQKKGWYVIERDVADHDFDPPIWVRAEQIARVRTREEARAVMLARTEAT